MRNILILLLAISGVYYASAIPECHNCPPPIPPKPFIPTHIIVGLGGGGALAANMFSSNPNFSVLVFP